MLRHSGTNTPSPRSDLLPVPARPRTCQSSTISSAGIGSRKWRRARRHPHPSLPRKRGRVREGAGVRSGDEPGAVITAARVAPKATDEAAAVNALEAADRRQRTGGERARIVAPDLLLRAL